MIPGEFIALLTFPGVIIHEMAHMLFCRLSKVAVLDVCYFRFGNPAGYVMHEEPPNFGSAFLISVGPFIVNSLLCILICFPAFVPFRIFDRADLVSYFLSVMAGIVDRHARVPVNPGRQGPVETRERGGEEDEFAGDPEFSTRGDYLCRQHRVDLLARPDLRVRDWAGAARAGVEEYGVMSRIG
jgi:hypothetical protein